MKIAALLAFASLIMAGCSYEMHDPVGNRTTEVPSTSPSGRPPWTSTPIVEGPGQDCLRLSCLADPESKEYQEFVAKYGVYPLTADGRVKGTYPMIDGDLMTWFSCTKGFNIFTVEEGECDVIAYNITTGEATEVSQRIGGQPKHALVSKGRVLYRDLPGPGTQWFPTRLVMWTERTNEPREVAFPIDSMGGAVDFDYPWVTFDARLNGTPYWFIGNVESLEINPIFEILRDDLRADGSIDRMRHFVIHDGYVVVEHLRTPPDRSESVVTLESFDLDGRFVNTVWEGVNQLVDLEAVQGRLVAVRNPDIFLLDLDSREATTLHPGLGHDAYYGNAAKAFEQWFTVWIFNPNGAGGARFVIHVPSLSTCELPADFGNDFGLDQDYLPYRDRLFFAAPAARNEESDIYWIPMPEECREP